MVMPVLNHGDTESSIRREVVDEVPEKSSSPPPTAAPEAPWEIQGHADTESLLGASDLLFGQGQSVMSGNFQDLTRNGPNQTEDGSSVHVIQDLMASTAAQSAGQVAMTNGGHALQDSSSLPEQTIARHVMPPSAMDHIPQDDDYRETGLTRLNLQNRQPRSSNMKKVSGSSSRSVDSDTSEGSMDTNLESGTTPQNREEGRRARDYHVRAVVNAQNSTRSGRASGPQSRASDEAVRAFESNQNMRGFTAPGARATSPEQLELSDEDAITNGQTDPVVGADV